MKSRIALLLAAVGLILVAGCGGGAGTPAPGGNGTGNPLPSVTSISPANANTGDSDFTLTVTGSNFVAASVVNWNGGVRTTTFTSATQLKANISAADLAIAGSAHVSVASPTPGGGSSGNITFTITPHIGNGIGLPGDPNSLAVAATSNLQESNVDGADIENGVAMDRLDVRFAADATVDQVNNALGAIGAGIVSMTQGFTTITIGVPRQSSLQNLEALAAQLESSPGIHHAAVAYIPDDEVIFPNANLEFADMAAQVRQLLPERFPAAWNLARTDIFGDPSNPQSGLCPISPVPVIVFDNFDASAPVGFSALFGLLQTPNPPPANIPPAKLQHGYDVSRILGANGFGANPFSKAGGCVDLRQIQAFQIGRSEKQLTDNFVNNLPAPGTKFIVNVSQGYRGCPLVNDISTCSPDHGQLQNAIGRAYDTLYWKERTKSRWSDFLMINSAGNQKDEDSTEIYPGAGDSRFNAKYSTAQLNDTNFNFVTNDSLWTPNTANAARGFISMKATASQVTTLAQDVTAAGMAGPDAVANNVIVVGSATSQSAQSILSQHVPGNALTESTFSDSNPDVLTVGEDVFNLQNFSGTSFAAPQVAGLASYLWMISPDLHDQPVSITKRIIVSNSRSNKVIDAYATVLALDGTTLTPATAPMRFALLNVHRDTKFDEQDLDEFLTNLFVSTAGDISHTPSPVTTADFSKFDLNGDGFTTAGDKRERFDLDRVGSTQFGASNYSNDVHETIEGQDIHFDETSLTDIQILCYYAYSPLYTGDSDARKNLMAGRCGISVLPATATIKTGQQQQFTVSLPNNDPVAWTITGAGNSITSAGVATAGNTAGTFTVTATDINSTNLVGTATLVVTNKSVDCAAVLSSFQNSDGLEVRVGVDDTEGPDRTTTTESTLTDSMSNGKASTSATASYPSLTASVDSSDTAGNGATALLQFSDVIVIVPNDPALVGTTATLTETYHFSSTGSVSGANAQADVTITPPDDVATTGTHVLSTQPQHIRGNINVQDEAFTGVQGGVILGDAFGLNAFMIMNAELTCNANNPTSDCDRTGTGTASESATLTLHVLTVTDQSGNSIGFSVCSVSGFTYGH